MSTHKSLATMDSWLSGTGMGTGPPSEWAGGLTGEDLNVVKQEGAEGHSTHKFPGNGQVA